MLMPQLDPPEVLRRLGFRCIEPREFTLRDGRTVTVQASGWMLADKSLPATENEARCLRLYWVHYSEGGAEELDEHDVASLVDSFVGEGAWDASA